MMIKILGIGVGNKMMRYLSNLIILSNIKLMSTKR